jgi:hypothetical protein
LLVIKERYQRGALIVMELEDFAKLFGALPEQAEE